MYKMTETQKTYNTVQQKHCTNNMNEHNHNTDIKQQSQFRIVCTLPRYLKNTSFFIKTCALTWRRKFNH